MPVVPAFPRRAFLLTSAAGGIACIAGCKPQNQAAPAPVTRTDVPLRVLICGDASWGDAISTAWGGIAKQPLAIEVLPLATSKSDAAGEELAAEDAEKAGNESLSGPKPSSPFATQVLAALARNDVAIVPCGVIPDVHESESMMPLGEDVVADENLAADRFFPAIGESLMRWAGAPVAVPLGCLQPSMVVSAGLAAKLGQDGKAALPRTWAEYDAVLRQINTDVEEPAAAEPLAGGAAAKMFLWRASDAGPSVWLFDRVTFEPALTDATYVQALETMRQNADHYRKKRLTAGEVWASIGNAKLTLALAWPAAMGDPPRVESIGDALAGGLPTFKMPDDAGDEAGAAAGVVLPDADTPLGIISSRCRQTVAAKRFLIWLSGGEGSEMIRSTVAPMTRIRSDSVSTGTESLAAESNNYENFLTQRLTSLNLRPALRLHGYDRYVAALDREVLACLDGEKTAADALAAASQAWKELTDEIGVERQMKAWRLAQGLRN